MTKLPLVNSRLTEGQNWSKPPQNNSFHVFTSNPRLSMIFINLDQAWPKVDTFGWPKSNFDPTIRMGWKQSHCEDSWISFPITKLVHRSGHVGLGPKLNSTWLDRVAECRTRIWSHIWVGFDVSTNHQVGVVSLSSLGLRLGWNFWHS